MSYFFLGGEEWLIVPIVKYRDAVPRIRWSSYPPSMGRGNFEGERHVPTSPTTLCRELCKNG